MGKFGPVFFLLLSLIGPALRAQVQAVSEHAFTLAAGGTLKLDAFTGAIHVNPVADTDRVRLVVRQEARARRTEAAERWLAAVDLRCEQVGNTLSIVARHRGSPVSLDFGDQATGSLRFELSVPQNISLDLATRRGAIDVGHDLTGTIRARVLNGSIFLGRVNGSVDAAIDEGDIVVSRATGNVVLKALRGDLNVGTIFGQARLETGSGSIDVFDVRQGLFAKAAAGNITAGFPSELTAEASLTTSGGDIVVSLDPAMNGCISARSTWGRIVARVPLEIKRGGPGQRLLDGRLNAGGPQLTLNASGGNVVMNAVPTGID